MTFAVLSKRVVEMPWDINYFTTSFAALGHADFLAKQGRIVVILDPTGRPIDGIEG